MNIDTSTFLPVISEHIPQPEGRFAPFDEKLSGAGLFPLAATGIEILQINLGKLCNQTCGHCHVDAGPDRKEIMSEATARACVEILEGTEIPTVDLTGGAPEMNPNFDYLIKSSIRLGRHVIDRCNLTILTVGKFKYLSEFLAEHGVEVVASLPYFTASNTDRQRGDGVFEKSIEGLILLNDQGYGIPGSGLVLNLVHNPVGAFLPPSQSSLERDFKAALDRRFGVQFNNLYTITNMPIKRYLEYLQRTDNYEDYMDKLIAAFNPVAAAGVMCRNTLSVDWQGFLYDCDFNQMLGMTVDHGAPKHISEFSLDLLTNRKIVTGLHCYGCTAGAGSSCGGAVV